jgi:hypothetical protein
MTRAARASLIVATACSVCACSTTSPSTCVDPYAAFSMWFVVEWAAVLGALCAAAPSPVAAAAGPIFTLLVCVHEVRVNMANGCGMPACGSLVGCLVSFAVTWIVAAGYGHSGATRSFLGKLAVGGCIGFGTAIIGMNVGLQLCSKNV